MLIGGVRALFWSFMPSLAPQSRQSRLDGGREVSVTLGVWNHEWYLDQDDTRMN
jgi:hypothetical protein